ncbi:MAG: SPOR domain-containing protein [Candidatus Krumholzibacteriia bacterium]
MRDDDRRPRFDDEDNLFSELRTEPDAAGQPPDGAPASLGPKAPPAGPPQERPGAPAVSAYPPEGFDSDEELGRLPSLPPAGRSSRGAPRAAPGRRPSRLILGVVCLAVVGAVFLFWRPGGKSEPPLGVGERTSTVTRGGAPAEPVTGAVDIAAQTRPLVPEPGAADADVGTPTLKTPTVGTPVSQTPTLSSPRLTTRTGPVKPVIQPDVGSSRAKGISDAASRPGGSVASGTARATGAEPPTGFAVDAAAGAGTPAASAPAAGATPAAPSPTAALPATTPGGQPAATGAWALQLGAFSTQENADVLAGKLRGQGLQPYVQTGSSSHGGLVFKVAIGYFATREQAAAYARNNARLLGASALPVHR